MKRQKSKSSKILQAVYEMALDLHRQGAIGKAALQEYKDWCFKSTYSGEDLRKLRQHYQLTQTRLAALLNVNPATVRNWEDGKQQPQGPSVRLLNLLERKGIEVLM